MSNVFYSPWSEAIGLEFFLKNLKTLLRKT